MTIPTPVDPIPLIDANNAPMQLGPDNLVSNLTLTCSVEIEGLFQWMWTGPGIDSSQVFYAYANRTSYVDLTQISASSAGDYHCEARYDPQGTSTSATGSRTFSLTLLCKYSICHIK